MFTAQIQNYTVNTKRNATRRSNVIGPTVTDENTEPHSAQGG